MWKFITSSQLTSCFISGVTENIGPCPGIIKSALFIIECLIFDWMCCNSFVPKFFQMFASKISSSFSNKSPLEIGTNESLCYIAFFGM